MGGPYRAMQTYAPPLSLRSGAPRFRLRARPSPFSRMPGTPASLLVIFGASGDLTWRKLIPSLFNLAQKGKFPANARIVGVEIERQR